jgi:exonuclease SbcD
MKAIHTADWHIGQKFSGYDRYEEHAAFLNWLVLTIQEQEAEALIVAGDIFDSANPTPYAQEMYYTFLAKLSRIATLKDVVVVGGNHDNPNLLNAPQHILKALNIHVVGAVPTDIVEQCIVLPTGDTPKLVVAAVPFLRDKDIRQAYLGESLSDEENRLKQGIAKHYEQIAETIRHYRAQNVPVLATGHLFAQGGQASEDSERVIHVGTLGQVTADAFTDAFDYVALGHLHRHQIVGGNEHIRYSGSPLPLSFTEADYSHQVLLLDFDGATTPTIQSLAVPVARRLVRISGTLAGVSEQLLQYANVDLPLPAWAEVIIVSDESPIVVNDAIDTLKPRVQEKIQIVKYQHVRAAQRPVPEEAQDGAAEDILDNPTGVFKSLLDSRGYDEEAGQRLLQTFTELLSEDDSEAI